jgi:hypothetical protein
MLKGQIHYGNIMCAEEIIEYAIRKDNVMGWTIDNCTVNMGLGLIQNKTILYY